MLPPTDSVIPDTENCTLAPAVTFAPTLSPEIILAIAQNYDRENVLKA